MAKQHLASETDGVATRLGQLKAWANHARGRLGDISPYAGAIHTRGARALLRQGHENLEAAIEVLNWAATRLPELHPGYDEEFESLHTTVATAEGVIRQVDQRVLPVLASRTRSDPKYDGFIEQFLRDLGFPETLFPVTWIPRGLFPVTSHIQYGVQALRVDTQFGQPIFLFSPSIRSFDAISLLYHEIGHVFSHYLLGEGSAAKRQLVCRMAPLDPRWPDYSKTEGIKPEDVTFNMVTSNFPTISRLSEEIIADAFAGLTGGHSFTSSLCNVFMFKNKVGELTSNRHPPAVWRVWLSRHACRLGNSKLEDGEQPLSVDDVGCPFDAWETVAGLSKHQSPQQHLLMGMEEEGTVADILRRLYHLLVGFGIPLARSTERITGRPPNLRRRSHSVPAILLAASKYRSEEDWDEYYEWERKMAPHVGLDWILPVTRRMRRVIKRYLATHPAASPAMQGRVRRDHSART